MRRRIVLYMIRFCQLFTTAGRAASLAEWLYMIRFCQLFTTCLSTGTVRTRLYMIRFCQHFKEHRCKDKHYVLICKIITALFTLVFPFSFGILIIIHYICSRNNYRVVFPSRILICEILFW